MVSLKLKNVCLDFPIYSGTARSLKQSLLAIGSAGKICQDARQRVIVQAIKELSLTLKRGDRLGLVGPNGSGKTTLLRIMAGIYQPTAGLVKRQGKVAPLFDLTLGMDPESTGYENIRIRGIFLGLTSKEINEKIDRIAEFSELGQYLSMPIRTYSSGMLLRLAFSVATCVEPEILLMDEWLSVGDAHFVQKAQNRLKEIVQQSGIMVLASHSLDLVKSTCNLAVLLDQGRMALFGPTEEVIQKYLA